MTQLKLTAETAEQLAAIGKLWGMTNEEAAAHVVGRFHATYIAATGAMPDGWTLREDLSLGDLESYYTFFKEEPNGGLWVERGSSIRAAIKAGWITAEKPLTANDVKAMTPAQAVAAKNALDALYLRLTVADPK